MTNSFFRHGIPQSWGCAAGFFEEYEKASPAELMSLQAEFEFMDSAAICHIDRYLLSSPRCDGRLTTIICSGLPKINNLDEEAIGYLMLESYKNYAADKYDQDSFEMNMVKLIDGYWPDKPRTMLGSIHGCINSGNLADASGVKKTKSLLMGKPLDRSIADQLRRSFVIGERYSTDVANMTASLASAIMPQSLQALLDVIMAEGDTLMARDLFQRLVREDALFGDYIDSFADKIGHDFVLSVVKDTSFSKSAISANNIADKYGESALFDQNEASIFDVVIESGSVPATLELILQKDFDRSKFPFMTKYLTDNISNLYECTLTDRFRAGLKAFGISNGCHSDVLSCEIYRLTRSLKNSTDMDLSPFNSSYIADKISREHHNPKGQYVEIEYLTLKDLVKEVGLENSVKVLKSVDGKLISDVMSEVIDQTDIHSKKRLLKMYPQAKGSVLENDLGL